MDKSKRSKTLEELENRLFQYTDLQDTANNLVGKMIKSVDDFAMTSAELVNHSLIIIGDRLDSLDEKVKNLENAGHITAELSADPNQLDLPFQGRQTIHTIHPETELKGEQK